MIINALKLEPNSEEKNKLSSKLEDAWAWVRLMELLCLSVSRY
jgi:hypothetical protein